MNYFQNQNFNPYFQQPMQQPMQRFQTPDQQYIQNQQIQTQPVQTQYKPATIGLQGKLVDSIEVVKVMDIPFDGSISYFPTTDGSAIITKQLQADGTSKTVVYKPTELPETEPEKIQYLTIEEFDEKLKQFDISKDIKEDIKTLKKQIKTITSDLDEIKERND